MQHHPREAKIKIWKTFNFQLQQKVLHRSYISSSYTCGKKKIFAGSATWISRKWNIEHFGYCINAGLINSQARRQEFWNERTRHQPLIFWLSSLVSSLTRLQCVHTTLCGRMQQNARQSAKNSVDIDAAWLRQGFLMLRHVAECRTTWKFNRQSISIIQGLPHQYLPSTVVRRNFCCGICCICVSHSTVFGNWNIVGKKSLLMWMRLILRHMLSNFCHTAKPHCVAFCHMA